MENQDHDVLIRLETSLNHICKKMDGIAAKVESLTDRTYRIPSWKSLISVAVIVVGIIGSIIAYNFNMDDNQWKIISKNKECIQENTAKIERYYNAKKPQ